MKSTVEQNNENLNNDAASQLQAQIDALKAELEKEQQKLLASDDMGMTKAAIARMNFSAWFWIKAAIYLLNLDF